MCGTGKFKTLFLFYFTPGGVSAMKDLISGSYFQTKNISRKILCFLCLCLLSSYIIVYHFVYWSESFINIFYYIF